MLLGHLRRPPGELPSPSLLQPKHNLSLMDLIDLLPRHRCVPVPKGVNCHAMHGEMGIVPKVLDAGTGMIHRFHFLFPLL